MPEVKSSSQTKQLAETLNERLYQTLKALIDLEKSLEEDSPVQRSLVLHGKELVNCSTFVGRAFLGIE